MEKPEFSIILPTYNASQSISMTLETILAQDFQRFEVIVVDGGSNDRTLEMIKNFYDQRIRICLIAGHHRYEMLNKGISLAHGQYINFLFPGDYYLNRNILSYVLEEIKKSDFPSIFFGLSLRRDIKSDLRVTFRSLNLETLKLGRQPTNLQSCWFHGNVFKILGKFSTHYTLRGNYEFFCRFQLHSQLRAISRNRVLVDFVFLPWVRSNLFTHFIETFKIVFQYFGFKTAIKWLFIQKDIGQILKITLQKIQKAFVGEIS